jgi:hypothetical protein
LSSPRDLLSRAHRAIARVACSAPARLGVYALLALVATWPYLSTAPWVSEFRDAQVLDHYEDVAALAVHRFRQAPLWDPYYCGGMYLLGTPQARFVSPTFVLTLLFGEARGAVLTMFAMVILALEGTYRYARSRGALASASFVAAPIFGLSGVFAVAGPLGWINFFGFALLPWIALGVRRALRFDARGAVLAAVCVAWCIGFGGTYAVPLAAVWCALEGFEAMTYTVITGRGRRVLGVVGMAALVLVLSAGLGAVRLWPVVETMIDAPRFVGGTPGFGGVALLKMLFALMTPKTENGTYYVGLLALPALVIGLARWRSLWLGTYAVFALWLAPGYAIKGSLFPALSRLPVFGTLRYPERYLILFAFAASALVALGITSMAAMARKEPRMRVLAIARATLTLAVVSGVVPMLWQFHHGAAGRELVPPPVAIDRPFHQARGTRWELAPYAPMQRGSLSCWDAYPIPESPLLEGDLEHEEYLDDPTAGHVEERRWSPNEIDLDVDLVRPARVVVNQNWHRGWRSSEGDVKSKRGLLAVDLPAGKRTIALRFAPRSARGGLVISLVSLVAIAFVARRRRVRFAVAAVATLLPMAAFAASLAAFREAHADPAPFLAPTGEEIVRDDPIEGSTRLDARLAGGITLVAARIDVPKPHAGDTIDLELDWRRDATIAAGRGVFVHIEPNEGKKIGGDHVQLSQVLSFDAAPPGKIVRDILPITMPDDSTGKTWKIWVGLWRIQRGGGRVPVDDRGSADVEDNRVLAGVVEVQ